jgi:hypothetical protein
VFEHGLDAPLNERCVGAVLGIHRRIEGDPQDVGVPQRGSRVGREAQAAGSDARLDQVLQARLEQRRDAGGQRAQGVTVVIQACDIVARAGQAGRRHGPQVP